MPSGPAVLVALSVRNGAAYIGEAVESVLAQGGVDLRLEVYDNGSSDDTTDVVARYLDDGQVRLVENGPGMNFFGSMNRALAGCTASFFAPFACDDRMLPGNLARKVEALVETGAGYAHGPVWMMDAEGVRSELSPSLAHLPPLVPPPLFFRALVPYNGVMLPSVVLGADALRSIGGFDARAVLSGDWLCWLRLALRVPVATVPEPLVEYRVHDAAGTAAAVRSGGFAEHDPATLAAALADPLFPAEWRVDVPRWTAEKLAHLADLLHDAGLRRAADGFAGYGLAARALTVAPSMAAFRHFERLALASGLVAPAAPMTVVGAPEAAAGPSPAPLRRLVAELRALSLAGLAERCVVAVAPDALEAATPVLESALAEGGDFDLDVVAADDPTALFTPGALAVAPFRDRSAAAAEARGVPVLSYDVPTPFRRPPVPDCWETLPTTTIPQVGDGTADT